MVASRAYLDKLASLRFFAALLVLLYHLHLDAHNDIARVFDKISRSGFIGVSIFYVLSGFVISYANHQWTGWKRYLIGRASRIYPAHLIVTSLVVLIFGISVLDKWPAWFLNVTLLQAWSSTPRVYFSLNAVSWSLSAEMFFYLAFIVLKRLSNNGLYILTMSAYLFVFACEIYLQDQNHWWLHWLFYINPLGRLPEFLIGMSLYRVYRDCPAVLPWIARLDFLVMFILMVAAVSVLGAIEVPMCFLFSTVPAIFSFLIVASLVLGNTSTYLHHRALVLLGEASFALYLLHDPLFKLAHRLISEYELRWPVLLMILTAFLAILISVLFHLTAETWATRLVRKRLWALLYPELSKSAV